jgi:REP element-mobilizing transposase RayT
MLNHFHAILHAEDGQHVASFLRRTLSLVSRNVSPSCGLWKERPMVLPIYSSSVLSTKVDYLHRNPVRAGLAGNPEDWEHSSYRQLVLGETNTRFGCDE